MEIFGINNELTKKVLAYAKVKNFNPSMLIINEGQSDNGLYYINSGVVKILKKNVHGKQQIINFLGKKRFLGISSLIYHKAFEYSAVTVTECKISFLPKEKIQQEFENNPNFTKWMLKEILKKADETELKSIIFMQHPPEIRLLYVFKEFLEILPDKFLNPLRVPISVDELSNFICSSKTSLYRVLKKWSNKGFINLKQGKISVNKLDELLSTYSAKLFIR